MDTDLVAEIFRRNMTRLVEEAAVRRARPRLPRTRTVPPDAGTRAR
jgi:hypothetical protein